MKLTASLIFLLSFLCIDALRAQPFGEWDPYSIHLDGTSETKARIPFRQGGLLPDSYNGNQDIRFGDGSTIGGTGATNYLSMGLLDDGVSRDFYAVASSTSYILGMGINITAGTSSNSGGEGGVININGGVGGVTSGKGGKIRLSAGQGKDGGIIEMRAGGSSGGGDYGYIRTGFVGTPSHFTLTSSDTRESLFVTKNFEVDGISWLDGSLNVAGTTTLDSSLNGVLKASSGVVSIASSGDLLSAIGTIDISSATNLAVSSPITLTGDTVGFDFSTNNTWSGTNKYTNTVQIDVANEIQFRDSAQRVYSSAANRLDLDAASQIYVGIAGSNEMRILANMLLLEAGAIDPFFDWSVNARLRIGVTTGISASNVLDVTNGGIIFNEDGSRLDARFEGDTDANLLFTDGTNDRVGVGTNAPAHKFSVTGKIYTSAEIEIDGALNHDGTTIGFYGVTPVARPSAYTQTYSTASRTHSNLTATSVSTTAATNISPYGYTTQAQADAIVTAINALINDVANVKQVLNSVIDDDQAQGLKQ